MSKQILVLGQDGHLTHEGRLAQQREDQETTLLVRQRPQPGRLQKHRLHRHAQGSLVEYVDGEAIIHEIAGRV